MRNAVVSWEGIGSGRLVFCLSLACALAALLTASPAPAATNLVQQPGAEGCVTENGAAGQCQDGRGLVNPAAIAVSPDGLNAYVASAGWDSLAVLSRDPVDGSLAPIGDPSSCFHSLEGPLYPDCTEVRELGGVRSVAVSPDGENVYVASPADDAVVVFDRDPATGALTLSPGDDGCVNASGTQDCEVGRALEDATAVVVSPDGENVYVSSSGPNGGVAVFDRDPTDGDLTQKAGALGCLHDNGENGCADGLTPLLGAEHLAISPDGATLYVVSATRDGLTIYSRDAEGALSVIPAPTGCFTQKAEDGCSEGVGLGRPAAVTVSQGGDSVYVAAESADAILVFDRDAADGELTQKPGTAGCVSNRGWSDPMQAGTAGDCQDGVAMDGVNSVAVHPDGSSVYATVGESSGVIVFERLAGGELTQRPGTDGCITDTGFEDEFLPWTGGICGDGRSLKKAGGIGVSADGASVYTTAKEGGVGIFDAVEAVPPPPPPPPEPPPPPPPPYDPTPCLEAREREDRLNKALPRAKRLMRKQIRQARRAEGSAEEKKLRRAVRRTRKRTRVLRRAWIRVSRRALAACYQ